MKVSKKRWLALFLATVMGTVTVSGCSKEEAQTPETAAKSESTVAETAAKADDGERVKLTYWAPLNTNQVQVIGSYEDTLYYQELQERLNIDIEFLHPPVGQEKEQFQLLIASRNELPDIIDYTWANDYPGGPEKAIKDGVIISLNDHMDKVPNYKTAFESDPLSVKEGTTDGGNIFGFHMLPAKGAAIKTMSGIMIRTDWLEELGLSYPETIADWEKTLTEFKEKKGAEAPFSIRFPDFKDYNHFNSAYKVGNAFYIDEADKVQYGPAQQGYKEFLTTFNRWYENGLIEQDFASVDSKYVDAQILNNQAGSSYGWLGGSIGTWTNGSTTEGFAIEAVANPVLNVGEEPFLAGNFRSNLGPTSACVTTAAAKDEKKMEAIYKMFDYIFSEEGFTLKTFGVEGETFDMVNNEPIYTELITENPDGLSMAQALGKYTQASVNGPGYAQAEGYINQYYQLETQKQSVKNVNQNPDTIQKHTYPPITTSPDEAKELAGIMTDIEIIKDEAIIAFITGVRPMEEYDSFIQELKDLGIDRAVEIKQAGLDRFNGK